METFVQKYRIYSKQHNNLRTLQIIKKILMNLLITYLPVYVYITVDQDLILLLFSRYYIQLSKKNDSLKFSDF